MKKKTKASAIILRILAIIIAILGLLLLIADTTAGIIALVIAAGLCGLSFLHRASSASDDAVQDTAPAPTVHTPQSQPISTTISTISTRKKIADYSLKVLSTASDLQQFPKQPYIVLDTETTGLSAATCELIELSMIKFSPDGTTDEFYSLFNPHCDVPTVVTQLTGIETVDLVNAPNADDYAMDIAAFIGNTPVVAHNAKFDCGFLCRLFSRNSVYIQLTAVDTVEMARRAFPGQENYQLDTLISSLKLSDGPQLHRAHDDVICTHRLFVKCLNALQAEKSRISAEKKAKRQAEEAARYEKYHDSPLYNTSFVFTGDFSIPRNEIEYMAVSAGGTVRFSVSKITDYLVKGSSEKYGPDSMSRKYKTALQLNSEGANIHIISEAEFMALISAAQQPPSA
jgi:DNA polymerase III epsilon subunit family exonuclease